MFYDMLRIKYECPGIFESQEQDSDVLSGFLSDEKSPGCQELGGRFTGNSG